MDTLVYKWDSQLSWELFSEAVYCYRQTLKPNIQQHKLHMFCKNGIFSAITSIEAFVNETLIKQFKWTKTQLDKNGIETKIKFLLKNIANDTVFNTFKNCKSVRNNYLVHHKRPDHKYVDELNQNNLINSIESVQELIAKITFTHKLHFQYWITGTNFINPHNKDITLENEVEFWRHIKYTGKFKGIEKIMSPSGEIVYPLNWNDYKTLYFGLWDMLKQNNFDIEIEQQNKRFHQMPYLTCKYWEL
ncbi:MAG: hypothetical protein AB1389_07290 [Campylobacterota bacterium]